MFTRRYDLPHARDRILSIGPLYFKVTHNRDFRHLSYMIAGRHFSIVARLGAYR